MKMLLKVLIILITWTNVVGSTPCNSRGNLSQICRINGNTPLNCRVNGNTPQIFGKTGFKMFYLWDIPSVTWNANIKAENGNGKNSLSVLHWNMGSRHWRRKTNEIVQILSEKHPDIFLISEANLQIETPLVESCIPNYSTVYPKTLKKTGVARLVALIKDGVHLEVKHDWMEDHTASIWMEVNQHGKKKLVVGAVCREQSLLRQPNSDDLHLQTARWNLFLKQWKEVGSRHDTFVIGDINLDTNKWQDPTNRNRWMIENIKQEIVTEGFSQLIQNITRSWRGQQDLCVD